MTVPQTAAEETSEIDPDPLFMTLHLQLVTSDSYLRGSEKIIQCAKLGKWNSNPGMK